MEESTSSVKIEKLNNSNFHAWKQKIILVLCLRDLDQYIDDTPPTDSAQKAVWIRGDRKAKAIIGLSLSDEHLENVTEAGSAKEICNTILNVFESHTLLNKLAARTRFYTAQMDSGEKVISYINRIKQLAASLKSMNVDIDDKEMAMAVLNGLPSAYGNLIVALDASGDQEKHFTLEFVKSRLLQEETPAELRKRGTSSRPGESALINHDTTRSNSSNANFTTNTYQCTNCGRKGHTASRCWGKDIVGKRPSRPTNNTNGRGINERPRENAFIGTAQTDKDPMSDNEFICLSANIDNSKLTSGTSRWIIDSGCTAHITFDRSLFINYRPVSNASVETGTKQRVSAVGCGDILLSIKCHSTFVNCKLQDVLYVPSFEYSLLSVSALDRKGIKTNFGNQKCEIRKGPKLVATGKLEGCLYTLETKRLSSTVDSAHVASLQLWHERLAHVDRRGIAQMVRKGVVKGIQISNSDSQGDCMACIQGKAHRAAIPAVRTSARASGMLDRIHSDVCGPMEEVSIGGSRYFVSFIDEHSSWVTVYCVKQKSEVSDCFLSYQKFCERQHGRKIRILRSDRGGEYLSNGLQTHFDDTGIQHELTTAYTPHQNGMAERLNRTLVSLVRSMLQHKGLCKSLWAEALSTAVYVRNRVTCSALGSNLTPHHIWKHSSPVLAHLRVFGSRCWYTVPKEKLRKLDARARIAIFVGYSEQSKAYKLIDIETRKVIVSRDVRFDEHSTVQFDRMSDGVTVEPSEDEEVMELGSSNQDDSAEKSIGSPINDSENEDPQYDSSIDAITDITSSTHNPPGDRPKRERRPPGEWWKACLASDQIYQAMVSKEAPTSYKKAVNGPDAEFWKKGIKAELDSLHKHNTWTYVPRSQARNVLACRWVFALKLAMLASGKSEPVPKGRVVAKGFQQVQGVDYFETFAPVIKFTSIRGFLAKVAHEDLEMHQMDVKTAFLNGLLKEEIFMEVPEGVEHGLQGDVVCKLKRSLYGTKQAPRCWNDTINSFFIDLGFTRNDADPCLYVKWDRGSLMMVGLYVDDMLLAAKTRDRVDWMKHKLKERFDMKDLGPARLCLGLEISRDRPKRQLFLSQSEYSKNILERFGMSDSKPVATPMEDPKTPESRLEWDLGSENEETVSVPYREAIGSLMYLMTGSRPDISYAVGKLARFCEAPKEKHWVAVKRVFRYINGTRDMGLSFDGSKELKPFGYSDSDWAGDVKDRKSTGGYVFMMAGAPISWCSRKQTVVATSTCEAEYIALSLTCREEIWIKRLMSPILLQNNELDAIQILDDSQSAIKLTRNESINRRNKHIDISYHFTRDAVERKLVDLGYTTTETMVADLMTKPLGRIKFERLRGLCGIRIQGENFGK